MKIQISCKEEKRKYNAYNLVKAFFPEGEVLSEVDTTQEYEIQVIFVNVGRSERMPRDFVNKNVDLSIRPEVFKVQMEEKSAVCGMLAEAAPENRDSGKRSVCAKDLRTLYEKLSETTGRQLPWGMLTGVRPVKLASAWMQEHRKEYEDNDDAMAAFAKWFYEDRFVSRGKAQLAFAIAKTERDIIEEKFGALPGDLYVPGHSVYISVPFCPSVCSYCSFSAGSIGSYGNRVEQYLEALLSEVQNGSGVLMNVVSPEKMRGTQNEQAIPGYALLSAPSTIYIGGGTPTALSEAQLEKLLSGLDDIFAIRSRLADGRIKEYTVEAGRPDSITRQKLEIIRTYGATRISINPQTMQQKTLDRIGRRHTVTQLKEAFYMAREMGFDNINMDLIMGLPGENNEDVRDTLEQIFQMEPDSLTVHALAVKRASVIGSMQRSDAGKLQHDRRNDKANEQHTATVLRTAGELGHGKPLTFGENVFAAYDKGSDITEMIEDAYACAAQMGMRPYYLYRQKNIAGNFENIGYAKPGKEGLYNILMMEEVQSIAAFGAGASSKEIAPDPVPNPSRHGQPTRILRRENPKNIESYIKKVLAEYE